MAIFDWILAGIVIFLVYKFIRWLQTKQTRYIPDSIKQAVLKRYFNMCAVCPETLLLEFHHRKEYSDNGDNSEKNIVPLCSFHHSLITRFSKNECQK